MHPGVKRTADAAPAGQPGAKRAATPPAQGAGAGATKKEAKENLEDDLNIFKVSMVGSGITFRKHSAQSGLLWCCHCQPWLQVNGAFCL